MACNIQLHFVPPWGVIGDDALYSQWPPIFRKPTSAPKHQQSRVWKCPPEKTSEKHVKNDEKIMFSPFRWSSKNQTKRDLIGKSWHPRTKCPNINEFHWGYFTPISWVITHQNARMHLSVSSACTLHLFAICSVSCSTCSFSLLHASPAIARCFQKLCGPEIKDSWMEVPMFNRQYIWWILAILLR